ncbi:MAG: hypothetical protein ACOWWM_09695 [Desulfobacterales bacterium]
MTDSIRLSISDAFRARASQIRQANGFATEIGAHAYLGRVFADPKTEIPGVSVFPQEDAVEADYGSDDLLMLVRVEALSEFAWPDHVAVSEAMLADMIEAFLATEWTLPFSAGDAEPAVGDTIAGATSEATGRVAIVQVESGSWDEGDAAGTITVRGVTGRYQNGEAITGIATISGPPAGADPKRGYLSGVSAVKSVSYAGGSPGEAPDPGYTKCSAVAEFAVKYTMQRGNPYL